MAVTYICPKSFSIDNLKATNPEQHGSASPQSASFSQAWPEKIKNTSGSDNEQDSSGLYEQKTRQV